MQTPRPRSLTARPCTSTTHTEAPSCRPRAREPTKKVPTQEAERAQEGQEEHWTVRCT